MKPVFHKPLFEYKMELTLGIHWLACDEYVYFEDRVQNEIKDSIGFGRHQLSSFKGLLVIFRITNDSITFENVLPQSLASVLLAI